MKNTVENFWALVEKTETHWIWKGAFSQDPTCNFSHSTFRLNHRIATPHRWAWFFAHGYWPRMLRRNCDVPECINPEHYQVGRKVTPEQEQEIARLFASGVGQPEIARAFDITQPAVSYILKCLLRRLLKGAV